MEPADPGNNQDASATTNQTVSGQIYENGQQDVALSQDLRPDPGRGGLFEN